ncbi:phosphatase PAP2 family protein [Streptomyces omiyaensis]|uniref:Phosphatase PAP2 family protein n=1 Tax=Streptomyces omiyaensis TaxID=68247 RepID=A0ABW7BN40_9ACTN|nr:phosphatase PAP2 family protein [Streptomyces omiyaensis]GGY46950.1 phosphatase PAP2 family protein [Streptomyces omiyaensis]
MRTSAVISGCLALVLLVLVVAGWSPLLSFDRAVDEALHRNAVDHPGFARLHRVLSDWVWDPLTLRVLAFAVALVLARSGRRRLALWVAGTVVAAAGVQQAVKALVGRERPVWPDPLDSASFAAFPSGHAMTAAVVCGLLLWVLAVVGREPWRGWGTAAGVAVVSVLGVGWTRLYLGVHWPTDVLAGWLLGWCCVAVAILSYRRTAGRRSPSAGTPADEEA